jgi:hypothetical protein
MTPEESQIEVELAEVRKALTAVHALIWRLAEVEWQAAFDASTELVELLRGANEEAGALRSDVLKYLRDMESLTIAELADRIRVSRTRAHQLVNPKREERARG